MLMSPYRTTAFPVTSISSLFKILPCSIFHQKHFSFLQQILILILLFVPSRILQLVKPEELNCFPSLIPCDRQSCFPGFYDENACLSLTSHHTNLNLALPTISVMASVALAVSQDDNERLSYPANSLLSVYGAHIKPKNIIMTPSISQTEVTEEKSSTCSDFRICWVEAMGSSQGWDNL